jgi:SsrA-binding protein
MAGTHLVTNKRARFEYDISETLEAGLVLSGQEVKSIRLGHGSLAEAFVRIRDGQAYLHNFNLPGYKFADLTNYEPTQMRKLLLHAREIDQLASKEQTGNTSIVPVAIVARGKKLKLVVGIGRGKKQFQKKRVIKQRDLEREVKRDLKQRLR